MLTGDFFRKNAPPLARETVKVPALGDEVIVSEMSAADRDAYDREAAKLREAGADGVGIRARFLVRCLRNPDGTMMLRADEAAVLSKFPPSVLDPLIEVATRLNGMGQKEVDKTAGESAGAPSADSPSVSA